MAKTTVTKFVEPAVRLYERPPWERSGLRYLAIISVLVALAPAMRFVQTEPSQSPRNGRSSASGAGE